MNTCITCVEVYDGVSGRVRVCVCLCVRESVWVCLCYKTVIVIEVDSLESSPDRPGPLQLYP